MISYDVIKKCNDTGQYNFPFKPSHKADCIRDFSITFEQFLNNKENLYSMTGYKYSDLELKSCWNMILAQRIALKAIIMVVENKYKGINQALRYLNELER